MPNVSEPVNVWYSGHGNPNYTVLKMLVKEANPDVIYLNGIYSLRLFLFPLLLRRFVPSTKIVVCPRGMLQGGALSVKSRKKKYYIKALQLFRLLDKVAWHATNEEEARDINIYFPVNKGIIIANNIPKTPVDNPVFPEKKTNDLKLVYLSLITQKKNLLLLLQVLKLLPSNVSLDIYGPLKDAKYWQQCLELINEMPSRVRYLGEIEPTRVQEKLGCYHALCLLTKGENFGHALYESLSVGRPIITSYFTPWNHLLVNHAGANLNISKIEDCMENIQYFFSLDQTQYNQFCEGALYMAGQYVASLKSIQQYGQLFKTV